MARRFFYVSAGIFLLALAYHLGARSAQGQAGGTVVGFAPHINVPVGPGAYQDGYAVLTTNGDVYGRPAPSGGHLEGSVAYLGNFWNGPTPAKSETWGSVKVRYR